MTAIVPQAVVTDNRLGINGCHAISRLYQATLMSYGTAKQVSVDCTIYIYIYIYIYICNHKHMYMYLRFGFYTVHSHSGIKFIFFVASKLPIQYHLTPHSLQIHQ